MSIRILALVGDCYAGVGGIARYNQELFEALANDASSGGPKVELLILPRLGNAADVTLPPGICQLPPIFNRALYSLAALWVAWRYRPLSVVFCGHVFMAPLAWALARLIGARYWLQTHGTDVWTARQGYKRAVIEAADLITAVSRITRRRLLAWTDLPPERVRVLPNTVRDIFTPGAASIFYRDRLGLGGGPVLLTVGRLSSTERSKGHESIFDILSPLRIHFPALIYLIAGDGDDRSRLEARARELALGPEIVRFLGYVPDEELPELYRLSDLFVMPSTDEGFGIVYLEAAACGLRVLGGAGDGSNDAIPNTRVGETVHPEDQVALLGSLIRMLEQGRVDPATIEPYRRPHFAAAARAIFTDFLQQSPRSLY